MLSADFLNKPSDLLINRLLILSFWGPSPVLGNSLSIMQHSKVHYLTSICVGPSLSWRGLNLRSHLCRLPALRAYFVLFAKWWRRSSKVQEIFEILAHPLQGNWLPWTNGVHGIKVMFASCASVFKFLAAPSPSCTWNFTKVRNHIYEGAGLHKCIALLQILLADNWYGLAF